MCSPITADIADDKVLEQARKKIEIGEDGSEWYFTLAPTNLTKAPNDTGPPVGKVGVVALPVISAFPKVEEGKPSVPATHIEVLMPSGKSGWIPVTAARPLDSERLCYAKTGNGAWKIAAYDQLQ